MKKDWEYKPLGEVCEKCDTIQWKKVPPEKQFQYIDLTAVNRDTLSIEQTQTIQAHTAPSRAKQIVNTGDVLFATTRPTLRRVCIVPNQYDNQICSTGFCVLRASKLLLPSYLFHLLCCDDFYQYIEPLQSGANYPAVTDATVKAYTIPVPPLAEQEAIVARLDGAFEKIDALRANTAAQLDLAKQLFQSTLFQLLSPQPHWKKKTLKEICTSSGEYGASAAAQPYNGKTRYVRITDITDDGELNDNVVSAKIDKLDKYRLHYGDILFARTGATVGKTFMYRNCYGDCIYAGYLIRFHVQSDYVLPEYVSYYSNSSEYYNWVNGNKASAAQPNINAQKYGRLPLYIPPLAEQEAIVARLDALADKVKQLQENLTRSLALCNDLKQALLREVFE